jgi:predicted membrane metal-binding protein
MVVALIVGVLILIGGIMNAMTIPLPTWMMVEMPLYLVVAWLAAKIELKRRSAA